MITKPRAKRAGKTPLTDAERHKRFVETASEVDADEDPVAFDSAFANVVAKPKPEKPE